VSVDAGTDVAKDAADVVLLEKDLGVLADGATEGRRTFANTVKYRMMPPRCATTLWPFVLCTNEHS